MTAPFPSLVLFYIRSVYGLSSRKRERGLKGALKAIGIAALVLLVAADLAVLFFAMDLAMYEALKPAGLQGLLLLNTATTASLIVFTLGFMTALSTYHMSQAETALLALPVKPRHLLGAKMAMVYLSESALAFLLMGIAAGIYGWMERPPIGFYLAALAAALAAPLVPLAAAYLVLVPLMAAFRPLRNKNAMMVAGGLVGVALALAFNVYIQRASANLADHAWIAANMAGPDTLVARVGSAYPPSRLAWLAMSSPGAARLLYSLASLALGLGAAAGVALLLGPAYAASLLGFEERRLRRVEAGGFIARALRRRRPTTALFLREWRVMNREPMWFVNGPLIVLLMPVIVAVMYVAQREQLDALFASLDGLRDGPLPMLAVAAFGAFLGSSTSVACTALSRDAKALPYLKALPVGYGPYMAAKLLHALAFSVVGAAVAAAAGILALGLGAGEAAGAFLVALAFSAFADAAGLWLDTANPRLSWDNPTAALKQNINSVVAILGAMGLIAGLGYASTFLDLGRAGFVALFAGGFGLLAALLMLLFPRYAARRLADIEV